MTISYMQSPKINKERINKYNISKAFINQSINQYKKTSKGNNKVDKLRQTEEQTNCNAHSVLLQVNPMVKSKCQYYNNK